MMGSQKMLAAAVAVVVAVEVAVVAGNYSIATGGLLSVADQMRGDTAQASGRLAQTAQETKEVVGNWAGWAKEKVQDGLGLCINHSAGTSEEGQQIADQTRKGKEKADQTIKDATQKARETAQKAEEAIHESAMEPMCEAQDRDQSATKTALKIKDGAQHHMEARAQENMGSQTEQGRAQAQDKMTKEDEQGDQAQNSITKEDEEEGAQNQAQVQAQENLSWAKGGYKTAKRKASDAWDTARKKISLGGTSSTGEL